MKHLFKGGRRKVAAVMAIALVASLSQVAPSSAKSDRSGGAITVGVSNQLLSTCFAPNASNSALGIMKTVFEGWVEKRSDGKYVPHLASSITASADFKSWTFKIRPGVKFHDGTALDVKTAITNIQASRGLYYLGAVGAGAPAASVVHTLGSGVPFGANTANVSAVSADSYRVDLWEPQVDFMASVYASGRNFVRAGSDFTNPTQCVTSGKGTGPFKFESVSPTKTVVVKNANYWRKDRFGEQLPYLNKITFQYVNQPSQRVNGLKSGKLDAAQFVSSGEVKQVLSAKALKNVNMIDSGYKYYPMTVLNTAIEPFNNKNARLAVAHATDYKTFFNQRQCYKGTCLGEIPTSVVGKANVGYTKAGFPTYNLAKAKQYVAAYKKETGKNLVFTQPADTSAESQASAKASQQIYKKAGITMNISTEDTATITAKAFPSPGTGFNPYQAYPTLLFEGDGVEFTFPFMVRNMFMTPNNKLVAGLGGPRSLAGGTFLAFGALINPGRTADPALDAAVFSAWYDTTSGRNAKIRAAMKYYQENAYSIAGTSQTHFTGVNKKLKGWDTYFLAGGGKGIPMTNAGINYTGLYLEK